MKNNRYESRVTEARTTEWRAWCVVNGTLRATEWVGSKREAKLAADDLHGEQLINVASLLRD